MLKIIVIHRLFVISIYEKKYPTQSNKKSLGGPKRGGGGFVGSTPKHDGKSRYHGYHLKTFILLQAITIAQNNVLTTFLLNAPAP